MKILKITKCSECPKCGRNGLISKWCYLSNREVETYKQSKIPHFCELEDAKEVCSLCGGEKFIRTIDDVLEPCPECNEE